MAEGENEKSLAVKMVILVIAIFGLFTILYPILTSTGIVDKTQVSGTTRFTKEPSATPPAALQQQKTPVPISPTQTQTRWGGRLGEALHNGTFVIAAVFVLLTLAVLITAGIFLCRAYCKSQTSDANE